MAEEKKKTVNKKNNSGTKSAAKTSTTKKATTKKDTTTSKKTTTKASAKSSTSKTVAAKKTAAKSTTAKKSTPKTTSSAKKTATKKTVKATPKKQASEPVKENVEVIKDNEVKTVEISKSKLIVGIVICVLIVVLCLVCFLGSNSVSTKYTSKSNNTQESSGGTDVLDQATKEAGEISDDMRVEPTLISVDDYLELYGSDNLSLVLLSKESCSYCQIAVPIIENIIYEKGVKISHIDVGNMSDDDTAKLINSDKYFSEGYGTPLLMVVGQNGIKDKIEGLTIKSDYEAFFKKYGFME